MKIKGTTNTGTLYQKTKGGVWYMRFTEYTPEGKRKRVVFSTGTADEEAAKVALAERVRTMGYATSEERHVAAVLEVSRNIENERLRIAKERAEAEAKRRADEEAAAAIERDRRAVTFAEAFVVYRASKKRPDSGEVTLGHYESQYNRFARWTAEHYPAVVKLRDFTPAMAEQFIDHIERTMSRNTRNKYLIFLRGFWRVLRREPDAQLVADPWDGIQTVVQTPDTVIHRELTVAEIAAIADFINSNEPLPILRTDKGNAKVKAGNVRDALTYRGADIRAEVRLLFAVGIYTGQRLGDCALLDWKEVDLARGIITLMPRKTARKYARQVIVPIHRAFAAILAETPKSRRRGPLMPTVADLYANNAPYLSKIIQGIMGKAGIETATKTKSGERARTVAGFHSLRHTFSSAMLNAGVSPALVDAMLCHAASSMTMRYYHEHADALLRAVSHLPALPQFASDAEAAENALRRDRAAVSPSLPSGSADAPRGILAAIRDELDGATADELKAALKSIKAELASRQRELA